MIGLLLAKAVNGDLQAEEELIGILSVRFRVIAKRRLRNRQDAEDVAQAACMIVLQKYKTASFAKGFEAWAYEVLRMKIGNHFQSARTRRKRLVTGSAAEHMPESAAAADFPGLRRKLIDCLKNILKVHGRYGRVLNLVYQGYKTGEICARLQISPNNMHVILCRGRSMLKNCLDTGRI